MRLTAQATPISAPLLSSLLGLDKIDFARSATAAMFGSGVLLPLEAQIMGEAKFFPWKEFVESLGEKALELFEIRADEIIALACAGFHVSPEYSDSGKRSADETTLVPVSDRTLSSEQHPCLQIGFRGQTYRVVFDVSLELECKGLLLEFRGGVLRAIKTGSVQGSGTIALGSVELARKEWGPVYFPGGIQIKETARAE
jgi:hypothetical protein